MRIGVDVGGTNTDAVLMNAEQVLASCKQPTTQNVSDGIIKSVKRVLEESGIKPSQIQCVMIGTTHFTNAFVERKKLLNVGIVRICLPAAQGIPPLLDWPEDILNEIGIFPKLNFISILSYTMISSIGFPISMNFVFPGIIF